MKTSRRTNPLGINERRTQRYATDPDYREHVVRTKRERWRARNGKPDKDSAKRSIVVPVYGRTRTVHTTGGKVKTLTFTAEELACLLGYNPAVLRGWQRDGRFPVGPYCSEDFEGIRKPVSVFCEPQARRLLQIMGQHRKVHRYLYTTDTETIAALFAAVKTNKQNTHDHGYTKQAKKADSGKDKQRKQGAREHAHFRGKAR